MSQSKTCPCFFEKKKVPGAHTSETGARASTKSEARTAGWGTDGQGKRDRKRDRVQLARQTASASNRSRLPRTQRTHSNNVRIPRDAQLRKVGARGTAHEALGGAGQHLACRGGAATAQGDAAGSALVPPVPAALDFRRRRNPVQPGRARHHGHSQPQPAGG